MNAVTTKHHLDFYVAEWKISDEFAFILDMYENDDKFPNIAWRLYRVGTVEGRWRETPEAFEILSIHNWSPGNGHLEDVLEWFEYACKRSKKPLRIRAFTNEKFKQHLLNKRGFLALGKDDVEKIF